MKIMREGKADRQNTERVTAKTAEVGGSPGTQVGGGEEEEEMVGEEGGSERAREGGREGARQPCEEPCEWKGEKKVGSGYRVRDWPEAASAQSMRSQGRGCAYVTACSG